MTKKMASLQRNLLPVSSKVQLVSFSIDPRVDTPDRLRSYAHEMGATSDRWRFVTGDVEGVRSVVGKGFRVGVGERTLRDDGRYDIQHSTHFVLVDERARIRGYFGSEEHDLALLKQALEGLLSEHGES